MAAILVETPPGRVLCCLPMAKARAILKRRKAVKNIRKITKTMQMIATAKFQKSLKRATGTKPYTVKVRELVAELAQSVGNVDHPLLRKITADTRTNKVALLVITANRGLAGAYNGSVLREAKRAYDQMKAAGTDVELYLNGKKGVAFFRFQGIEPTEILSVSDEPTSAETYRVAETLMDRFTGGHVDAVHMAYMNFITTGSQKPEVNPLLPLSGVTDITENLAQDAAERDAQLAAGTMDATRAGDAQADALVTTETEYDFMPDAASILNDLLPTTVKAAVFQAFLDATTSEHVARMVAMKSATDNADKMGKELQLQYNRARQSQITTELSEIMGGVESMSS
jgi:F-type H+-transporting ATPase subunit gamma